MVLYVKLEGSYLVGLPVCMSWLGVLLGRWAPLATAARLRHAFIWGERQTLLRTTVYVGLGWSQLQVPISTYIAQGFRHRSCNSDRPWQMSRWLHCCSSGSMSGRHQPALPLS